MGLLTWDKLGEGKENKKGILLGRWGNFDELRKDGEMSQGFYEFGDDIAVPSIIEGRVGVREKN